MEFFKSFILITLFGNLMNRTSTLNFLISPNNATVNSKDNLTLECVVDQENIMFSWEYKPIHIKSDSMSKVLGFCFYNTPCVVQNWTSKITMTRDSRLTIHNISSENSGYYVCKADSVTPAEHITSFAVVTVKTPPKSISFHFNKSVNVFQEHEFIAIQCSVSGGIPPPKISMYIVKDNEINHLKIISINLPNATLAEVSAISLWRPHYLENRGFVMCTANNDAGSLTRNTSLLNIKYKPKIKPFVPNIIDAMVNQTIDLSCEVNANPAAKVQWLTMQRSQIIDSSKFIAKITQKMGGPLICKAENVLGLSKETVQLNILKDPVIHIDSNYRIQKNSNYSINCLVTSNPPPEFIKWYKLSNKTDSSAVLISDDAKLNFIRIDRSSTGMYACVTQNIQISTTGKKILANSEKTMFLIVTYKPSEPQIMGNKIISVMKGESFILKCSTDRKSPGEPFPTLKWIDMKTRDIVSDTETFQISSSESQHNGKYKCLAENEIGKTLSTDTALVTVKEAPSIISQNKTRKVFLSYSDLPQSISFTCEFRGQPLYESLWRYGNEIISPSSQDFKIENYQNISNDRLSQIFSKLTIDLYSSTLSQENSLRSSPNGRYNCESKNRYGIATLDYFLIIKYPPTIKYNNRYRKFAASLNQNSVKILCQAHSISMMHIKWYKTNEHTALPFKSKKYTIYETEVSKYDPDRDLFTPSVKLSELTIRDLDTDDFSNYSCVSSNEQGIKKVNFEVVFKSQPDPPYDLQVTDFEWDSVTISWKPGFDGGLAQNFEILVISENFGTQNVPFYSEKDQNTLTITGLFPSTSYEVKIYAVNSIGRSLNSDTVKCVTKRIRKFDKIQAKILSDQPKIAVIILEPDVCANLEYTRDNGNQWFSILHCIRFNASHINETVLLDITRVTSILDLQSGLIHLRLTFCLISRPSVCSPHRILENPKNENLATQTVILVITVICFLLIIILIALFIVCCIRFRYHCVSCNQYFCHNYCCFPRFFSATNKPIRHCNNNRITYDGKPLSCSRVSCQDILDENDINTGSTSNYCSSLIGSSTPHIMNKKCHQNSSNDGYSSFICPHHEFRSHIPVLYEGSSFLQPTVLSWSQKISPPSCEASSSHSHSSSTGSSSRNLPQNPVHYRKKQDGISNNNVVNHKSYAQTEGIIKLPDVTSEAIHFVKPDYNEKLMEAVV